MVELQAVMVCPCGENEVITEPEGGQSLFGTASWKALKHTEKCRGTAKIKMRFIENE